MFLTSWKRWRKKNSNWFKGNYLHISSRNGSGRCADGADCLNFLDCCNGSFFLSLSLSFPATGSNILHANRCPRLNVRIKKRSNAKKNELIVKQVAPKQIQGSSFSFRTRINRTKIFTNFPNTLQVFQRQSPKQWHGQCGIQWIIRGNSQFQSPFLFIGNYSINFSTNFICDYTVR